MWDTLQNSIKIFNRVFNIQLNWAPDEQGWDGNPITYRWSNAKYYWLLFVTLNFGFGQRDDLSFPLDAFPSLRKQLEHSFRLYAALDLSLSARPREGGWEEKRREYRHVKRVEGYVAWFCVVTYNTGSCNLSFFTYLYGEGKEKRTTCEWRFCLGNWIRKIWLRGNWLLSRCHLDRWHNAHAHAFFMPMFHWRDVRLALFITHWHGTRGGEKQEG